jgi:hypothetical protein
MLFENLCYTILVFEVCGRVCLSESMPKQFFDAKTDIFTVPGAEIKKMSDII